MWFVTPQRGHDLIEKLSALDASSAVRPLDRLYGILTILDAKATGLLTVNALFVAVLGILLLGEQKPEHEVPDLIRWTLFAPYALAYGSAVLCLYVVRVTWRFLGQVEAGNFETEVGRLASVVEDRTHLVQIAWYLQLGAFIFALTWWLPWWCVLAILSFILILDMVERLLPRRRRKQRGEKTR